MHAEEILIEARWPRKIVVCPWCHSTDVHWRVRPGWFRCRRCKPGHNFTVRAGTVMAGSHTPYDIWLKATTIALKEGLPSGAWLAQRLGVTKPTGYWLLPRLELLLRRRALFNDDAKRLLVSTGMDVVGSGAFYAEEKHALGPPPHIPQ